MKPVSGKELCKALERNGWTLQRTRGSHHIYTHPDRAEIVTVPVHGSRDLRAGTQRAAMRAAGLTDADL